MKPLSPNLCNEAAKALTAAESERDAAVAWIGCVRDELVIAGFPPGDRTVMLAHLRTVLARAAPFRSESPGQAVAPPTGGEQ